MKQIVSYFENFWFEDVLAFFKILTHFIPVFHFYTIYIPFKGYRNEILN